MSFFSDFISFLMKRKKLWLIPSAAILLIIGALIILSSGSAIAPFVYTIF